MMQTTVNHHLPQSQPRRHLRFHDENSISSSQLNKSLSSSHSGRQHSLHSQQQPEKQNQQESSFFSSSSSGTNTTKTPGSKKKMTRRAFGDISNKKRSHSRDEGVISMQKPLLSKTNTAKTSVSSSNRTKAGVSKIKAVKSVKKELLQQQQQQEQQQLQMQNSNHNEHFSAADKKVSFVLSENGTSTTSSHVERTSASSSNPAIDPFELTGVDPIEQLAGRPWSKLERWIDDQEDINSSVVDGIPYRLDTQQIFANRISDRELEQVRTDQEGWDLIEQEIKQVARQDELDAKRMTEEFYTKLSALQVEQDNDSLDDYLASQLGDDLDNDLFLDVSF